MFENVPNIGANYKLKELEDKPLLKENPKEGSSSVTHYRYYSLLLGRCPWCNGYRSRKWTRRHESKSWTRLIVFHIALIPLGKV